MPRSLTILPQTRRLRGDEGTELLRRAAPMTLPRSVMRLAGPGSFSALLIAAFGLATIADGMPFGATAPTCSVSYGDLSAPRSPD